MEYDDNFSYGDDYSYDYGDFEYDDNSFGSLDHAYEGDMPRSSSWDYDSDDEYNHRQVISSSAAPAKPLKHSYLVSFDTSLKQLPSFDYVSLPPNQKDRSKRKLSFVHLMETLLEEDMSGPFASSLLEYGFGNEMTILLDMTFEDIDDLNYFDASSVKNNLSSSCKKLVVCLRHLMYHKQLWYDWTIVTPSMLNSCLLYTSPSPRDRTRSRMPSSA